MSEYLINYTRNDRAHLEWHEWLNGYPNWVTAVNEATKLRSRNQDFDFVVARQAKNESQPEQYHCDRCGVELDSGYRCEPCKKKFGDD